jgi:hypothetical protein
MATVEQLQQEIADERAELVRSVDRLRAEVAEATDVGGLVQARLPLFVLAAFAAGFVLGGGIGASMRYAARRGRERR